MLIQAHTERLRGRFAPGEPGHQDSLEIEGAVTRAGSLIQQLLAFGRKQVLQTIVLNLNPVVTEVAKMLGRVIANQIELRVLLAPELGRVKADPGQVEQIILNLALNARDAMPHGGQLVLETRNVEGNELRARNRDYVPAGKYVMLSVTDTGIGMDGETQAHMFEPFFTTKEPGKGTGLGLATVYGVVKQMDGAIWVRSEPGNGTTFEIYLPCVEPVEEEPEERGRGFTTTTSLATAPDGTETVLLVEDQDGIRDLVQEFLQRKGYTVLHAVDGTDALRIAGEYKDQIHLLVTDVVMPNIGGQELARRLTPLRPQMKVLFMSGYPEHASLGDEAVDGNMPVLLKPFLLDALAREVRRVLGDRDSG
jgi:CheY-like chemotaxis protein